MNSDGYNSLDIETTNIVNCLRGVYLLKGTGSIFIIGQVIFYPQAGQTCVVYDPSTYTYSDGPSISNNIWNGVGTFLSGFDFSLTSGRDADIFVTNNAGYESKNPHIKINIVDGTSTTTITSSGTYYTLLGMNAKFNLNLNVAATGGTFTITYHGETTGNIAYNASTSTIKTAIEALSNVTTVTVVNLIASKEWTVEFVTALEGFSPPITMDISNLTTSSSVVITKNFYVNKVSLLNNKFTFLSSYGSDCMLWYSGNISTNNTNKNVNFGIKKNGAGNIIAPMTCRTATSNVAYPFSGVIYLEDVKLNDYYEFFVTSSSDGDVVRLWDFQALLLTN
jgi:hypothetical protein